ncbi:MAG: hypothetical protein LBD48_12960 [Treponema sp.]|nr:hypothetical protein [Treponema sp.]
MKNKRVIPRTKGAALAALLVPALASAFAAASAAVIVSACTMLAEPVTPPPHIYSLAFDRERYVWFGPNGGDFQPPANLKLYLKNTGNMKLENVNVAFSGADGGWFGVEEALPIASINPGETIELTVVMPVEDFTDPAFYPTATGILNANILAGNQQAIVKMPLTVGLFKFVDAGLDMDLSTTLLQMGNTRLIDDIDHTQSDVEYLRWDDLSPDNQRWISTNEDVAWFESPQDEVGTFAITGPGETVVGVMVNSILPGGPYDPLTLPDGEKLTIKGKRIRVYPLAEALNPEYPVSGGVLQRPSGGLAMPLNMRHITAAGTADFTHTGGIGVIDNVNAVTGELTFTGTDGAAANVTVKLAIKQAVPEGFIPSHFGAHEFNAKIGAVPAAQVLHAETINEPSARKAVEIEAVFNDFITNTGSEADLIAALQVRRTAAGGAEESLAIARADVEDTRLLITLADATPVRHNDVLALAYSGGGGAVGPLSNSGVTVPDFDNVAIVNNLINGPKIITAVFDGANPVEANKLTITYDKPPVVSAAEDQGSLIGFSMVNTKEGSMQVTIFEVKDNALILSLNRIPAKNEIEEANDAFKLAVVYNVDTGMVADDEGHPAVGQHVPVQFVNYGDAYSPPELLAQNGIVLDGGEPAKLQLSYNKVLAAQASYGGFSLNLPDVSITGSTLEGNNEKLVLNLSRAITSADIAGLSLSYQAASGNIQTPAGIRAIGFTALPVTVINDTSLIAPPVVTGIALDAANPTLVVLTYDQAVTAANSYGFSIAGSISAGSFLTTVTGSGTNTLTLTLNRKPAYDETVAGLTVSYSSITGTVKLASDGRIASPAFTAAAISCTGFDEANFGRPAVQSIVIDGTNLDTAKNITITYSKDVQFAGKGGFSVSGSATANLVVNAVHGASNNIVIVSLINAVEPDKTADFRLHYDMTLGTVSDANGNEAATFTASAGGTPLSPTLPRIDFQNYGGISVTDTIKPWIVSATVEHATPAIVRVVFSEAVKDVDAAKFKVKINDAPYVDMASYSPPAGGVMLDAGTITRDISSPAAVAGSDNKAWDLTMSAPAQFGEILRLLTTANGAVKDNANNELPEIKQFIVRSLVGRDKQPFENEIGLYRDFGTGTFTKQTLTDLSADKLYEKALAAMRGDEPGSPNMSTHHADHPKAGETIILVLDTNQTMAISPPWNSYRYAAGLRGNANGAKVVITAKAGVTQDIYIDAETTGAALAASNSIAVVIEDHIVIRRKAGVTGAGSLVNLQDGGKMIVNGGVIRDNNVTTTGGGAGGVTMGGGNYAGTLIINAGGVINNTVTTSNIAGGSQNGGAIAINNYGLVVMHGGQISGNTLIQDGSGSLAEIRGGAVSVFNSNDGRHGATNFYMTGGEIRGNKVVKGTATTNVASAGAVIVTGTFQKVGGTIYGSEQTDATYRNSSDFTGTVKAGAVVVVNVQQINPGLNTVTALDTALNGAIIRDKTSGPEDYLFIESRKPGGTVVANNTKPAWAQLNYWDN